MFKICLVKVFACLGKLHILPQQYNNYCISILVQNNKKLSFKFFDGFTFHLFTPKIFF